MTDSNHTSHPENVHIGPGRLCFYDEVHDHLIIPGKVENIIFDKLDPANVFQMDVINGRQVEVQGQATEDKYRLNGKFVEALDPNTLYLMMKNCGTHTLDALCSIKTVTEEYHVYDDRSIILVHNNGFFGTAALPAPTNLLATKVTGVPETIPDVGYGMVVTAVYGETEGTYAEVLVTMNVDESLLLTWDPPSGGTPDSYKVYMYLTASETRADSGLVLETNDTSAFFTEFTFIFEGGAAGDDYPGDATGSFIIADTNDVPYTAGTDYTVDSSCALVTFPSTGSITNGQTVRITSSYRENENVSMSIGPAKTNPKLVRPVILAFKDDDRTSPNARGIEIELWKTLSESGWSLDISALNFDSGFEFAWPVLCSEYKMNHGMVTTFNRHYITYDVFDLAKLTNWHNADACEFGTS